MSAMFNIYVVYDPFSDKLGEVFIYNAIFCSPVYYSIRQYLKKRFKVDAFWLAELPGDFLTGWSMNKDDTQTTKKQHISTACNMRKTFSQT